MATTTITMRLHLEELEELQAAAAADDEKVTTWIRTVALAAARGEIHPEIDQAYTHLVQALAAVEPDASDRVKQELAELRKEEQWPNGS